MTEDFRGWLRLQLMLSGIALAMVAVRTAEMAQTFGRMGGAAPWGRLIATESAIWLAWSLWAAALILLMRRLLERERSRAASVVLLGLLAVAPAVVVPLLAGPVHWLAFSSGTALPAAWLHMAGHNLLVNLLLGTTTVGVAYSYLSLRRARRLEVTAAQLNAQLADAQLETLRAQIEPHFLFNALNSIAVLARRGRMEDVERMVTRLAGLLRHSLDSFRAQEVTLGVELMALRHYLEIEEVRYGDRLVAEVDVPEALHGRVVPSFLLQPLVENAIRHGYTDPERALLLEVRAEDVAGGLRITVTDDGAGVPSDPQTGIGLGHTRARLAGLYGERASLAINPRAGRGTIVTIELPPAGASPA